MSRLIHAETETVAGSGIAPRCLPCQPVPQTTLKAALAAASPWAAAKSFQSVPVSPPPRSNGGMATSAPIALAADRPREVPRQACEFAGRETEGGSWRARPRLRQRGSSNFREMLDWRRRRRWNFGRGSSGALRALLAAIRLPGAASEGSVHVSSILITDPFCLSVEVVF